MKQITKGRILFIVGVLLYPILAWIGIPILFLIEGIERIK